MKVLVCGGRKYSDYSHVKETLDGIHKEIEITDIIHGCATGADMLGHKWCSETLTHSGRYIRVWQFPAKWRHNGVYNPRAGFERNQQMLDEGKPDLVVAFPGGNGTADMVRRAKEKGVPVMEV